MVDSGSWSSLLVNTESQNEVVSGKSGRGVDCAWQSPQLSIISDSSCSRSSSPMPGSTSSSRWSRVNESISSSKSSTAEVEAAVLEVEAVRDAAALTLRDLGWVGLLRTGLKCDIIYLVTDNAAFMSYPYKYQNSFHSCHCNCCFSKKYTACL